MVEGGEHRSDDEEQGNERPYHKRAVHARIEYEEGREHRLPPFERVERRVLAVGVGYNLFVAVGVGHALVRAAREHLRQHNGEYDQHQHDEHRRDDGFLGDFYGAGRFFCRFSAHKGGGVRADVSDARRCGDGCGFRNSVGNDAFCLRFECIGVFQACILPRVFCAITR